MASYFACQVCFPKTGVSKHSSIWKLAQKPQTRYLDVQQLLHRHLLKGFDGEQVVVGAGQVGRGNQGEAADVAGAGDVHHPGLAPVQRVLFVRC